MIADSTTSGRHTGGPSPRADGFPPGRDEDAVEQARRWLAERGIAVSGVDADADARGSTVAVGRNRDGGSSRDAARKGSSGLDDVKGRENPADLVRPADLGEGAEAPTEGSVGGQVEDANADPESVARTIVLGKLSVQARTRAELEKVLKAKKVPEDAATSVLDRMETLGLVDDAAFARDWIESRQQRRYLSKVALRRELTAKGIERTEIDSALERVGSDEELSAARALVAKKLRSMGELAPEVRHRRLAGVLGRRGFTPSVVSRVLRETSDWSQS